MTVTDDGVGFVPDAKPREVAGMVGGSGLAFMSERVTELDGELEVLSEPGAGTLVRATIPIVGAR